MVIVYDKRTYTLSQYNIHSYMRLYVCVCVCVCVCSVVCECVCIVLLLCLLSNFIALCFTGYFGNL